MPEAASAVVSSPTTSTSTAAPVTGGGGASAEPKITYGSPEGDSHVTENEPETQGDLQTDGAEGGEADEFGELDAFGDEEESVEGIERDKFTSEQYKALKQALAANPELFKAVKREISENSRYKQLFESPEAAREVSERIEALGGIEGIETESQEWSKVFEMFKTGDPGVIDYWAKDNPQALAKLFPHVYDRMADMDPAVWSHKAAGTFVETARQTGMIAALNVLSKLEAVAKSAEASAQVNAIIEALNNVDAIAKKPPTPDLTPEAQKLSEREKQLKAQEQQLYIGGLQQKIAPLVTKTGRAALSRFLQGKKLSADAQKGLLEDVNREYAKLTSKDETFQKNRKALLAAGETDKLVKLVTAQLNRTMPMAAKRAWRKYEGISGFGAQQAAQRKAEGQARRESGGGGASINVVAGQPPRSGDVDWARMKQEFGKDFEDVFMFGKKPHMGGKRVYFKKGDKTAYAY